MSQEMPTTNELEPFLEEAKKQFVDPLCAEVQIGGSPLFLARESAPVATGSSSQVLEIIQSPHGILYLVNPQEGYKSERN